MANYKLRALTVLILLVLISQVEAATQVKLDIEVVDKGETTKHTEIITLTDKEARFDLLATGQQKTAGTPYLLTIDGGKNWVIGGTREGKPTCAQLNVDEFFQKIGGLLINVDALVNPEIAEPKITKVLEEDGPKIMGFPTKHVQLKITTNAEASFLFKKYEYSMKITDDIWYATNLEVHPIRKQWFRALSQSGYPLLDKIYMNWSKQIKGAVLRQDTVITLTNLKEKTTSTQSQKAVITSIKELKAGELEAGIFKAPECKKITNKQVRQTATDMFKEGKVMP